MTQKHCIPCEEKTPKIKGDEIKTRLMVLRGWRDVDEHHLIKTFPFKDFKTALDFVDKVGALAEEEGHHPDILLSWGRVEITLFTHAINGLSENDFILAEMIEALL